VRDFLRYEIRYEFISDLISVFLVCSEKGVTFLLQMQEFASR
jgi:hypothetical protein